MATTQKKAKPTFSHFSPLGEKNLKKIVAYALCVCKSISTAAQSGVSDQKPGWHRKNCPLATTQTDPPVHHPSQGARRKKKAV